MALVASACATSDIDSQAADVLAEAEAGQDEARAASQDQIAAPDDPQWNCTVVCTRLDVCMHENSTADREQWLVDKEIEGCETLCNEGTSERTDKLAAAAVCDREATCEGFFACVQSLES